MSDIIAFLRDSTESAALRKNFLRVADSASPEKLCDWMNKNGYNAEIHECRDLIAKRKQTNRQVVLYTSAY